MEKMSMDILTVTPDRGTRSETLAKAIKSIKEQDYEGKITSYVVSDGGGRFRIPKSTKKRVVKFIERKERGGPGAARNSALLEGLATNPDCVCFLDSDDVYYPGFVRTLSQYVLDYDVVYGDLLANVTRRDGVVVDKKVMFSRDWHGRGSMENEPFIPLPSALMRADYFEKYGLFREDIGKCVDWELFARGEARGARFLHVKEIVGEYTWNFQPGNDGLSTNLPELTFPPTTWARIKTIIGGHYI